MNRCQKRRALSSVVAGGILLSAVAILGTGLVTWASSSFASHQEELNASYNEGINKLNEFLIIENVWFGNSPTKYLNITITNTGNNGLNITKIILDDKIDKLETKVSNGGIISEENFSTELVFDWKTTNPIEVTVMTEKGSMYRTYVMGS